MVGLRFVICMGVLMILVTGCEKEFYEGPEDQPVYFEYHYINYAWGVADNGWMIDNEGNMLGYNFPADYRFPDSTGHLTFGDLQYNLDQTDTLLLNIKSKELRKYTRLIGGAADGNLGESQSRGADMGSATLSCYAYDPRSASYKYVLLATVGDWEQFNRSAEAETLVDWLKEFGVAFLSD